MQIRFEQVWGGAQLLPQDGLPGEAGISPELPAQALRLGSRRGEFRVSSRCASLVARGPCLLPPPHPPGPAASPAQQVASSASCESAGWAQWGLYFPEGEEHPLGGKNGDLLPELLAKVPPPCCHVWWWHSPLMRALLGKSCPLPVWRPLGSDSPLCSVPFLSSVFSACGQPRFFSWDSGLRE